MSSPLIQAKDRRSAIVERMVGETGEPARVESAARALAERVAPALLAELNAIMSFPLEIELVGAEIVRFAQARPAKPTHEALAVVPSASSPDALAILADGGMVGLLVAAFFGGDPAARPDPVERPLTAIEIEIVSSVFTMVAHAFNGSGPRALDLKFPLPPLLSGAELARLAMRDGPAARILLKVSTPGGSAMLQVTMPQRVLLTHRPAGGEVAAPAAWRARFSEEVMRSSVRLEATVALERMTLDEIAGMKVGQVLELPGEAQTSTRLSARRKPVFVCEFGKLGNHFTVRVRHPYDADKEFMDGLIAK